MKVCPHDIDRNQPCALCVTSANTDAAAARTRSPDVREPLAGRLCDAGSGLLLTNQPVPASDDAGRSEARDAIESGIWLTQVTHNGNTHYLAVLASDGRAIELLHAGFELREMDSLEDALMAAEAQTGGMQ